MMGQEHLRNIALLPEAEVVAVFEPDPGMAAAAAALAPGARMVASVADLLAVEAVNALLVASPNHLHLDQLEQIAATRPLPVLCEKPLFTDATDTGRLAALKATYPAPLWVAMEYRYMPPVARLIAEAQATTGGVRMLTIREHRFPFLPKVGDWNRFNRNTGGTLVEKCCHFFDLMRLIAGCDPVRVMASGGQGVNHLDETYDGA
ncbi:MAG: Gfo/Idh/MocA family protein, partial [Pseudorhodobacter sp.]